MDIDDDDRFLNIDNTDLRKLQTFKVPKKNLKNKYSFEKVPLQSNEYKDNIYPKIVTSYKNPNSFTTLKILAAYSIYNSDVEKTFMQRKQNFKKDFSSQIAVESYGFVYLNNLSELRAIVKSGRLRNGNLKESVLGKANMGVSISQFSDIYHPGDGKTFPRNGLLLIVKYLKGRIYHVLEDNDPMEPQPNYDCHVSKNCNQDSYPSMSRGFHSTQTFIYEYSDDFDLIDEPTQIMPWAAVEFTWIGPPLYKLISVPIVVPPSHGDHNAKDHSNKVDKRLKSTTRTTGCPPQRIKQIYTDSTPVFCTQLQLRLSKSQKEDDTLDTFPMDIPVTILSYHALPVPFDPLMTVSWQICELMEWSQFEKEFIQPILDDKSIGSQQTPETNFNITDVFNKRITISRNIENKFNKNMQDSMKLLTFGIQYVNYWRMVVNDPSRDRAKMARLVEHFLETKTVGRIKIQANSDSLLFVFPDSTLSQNFGIPSVRTLDVNYLHVLLVTTKSLDYNVANRNIDESLESDLRRKLIDICDKQDKVDNKESIIPLHVLRQSINCQNTIQKSKLRQICGIMTNIALKFDEIKFSPVPVFQPDPIIGRSEDGLVNSSQKLSQKVPQISGPPKDKSPVYDRPYDPTENLVGLSDFDSVKAGSLKRSADVKKSQEPSEPLKSKKVKREDLKNELNTKLFQLFAKIENTTDTVDSNNVGGLDNYTTPFYKTGPETQPVFYRHNESLTYPSTLDRNKFQTKFRHGVSVYVPETNTGLENSMDKDFRFPDTSTNQPFIYSERSLRQNGWNR